MMATAITAPQPTFPLYAPANGEINDFDIALLEEYTMDDELGLDLFSDGGASGDLGLGELPELEKCHSGGSSQSGGTTLAEESIDGTAAMGSPCSSKGNEVAVPNPKKRKAEPRKKSEQQMERRRERNRILARKTRLRKKFFFESLQRQVFELKRENSMLKDIVRDRMKDKAAELLSKFNTQLPSVVAESMAEATSLLERRDFNLVRALQTAQQSFVVTDPSLPDNPIVFASQGFLDMTGYTMGQVLGRNCRFLQGPDTDQKKIDVIRKGIAAGRDTSVCILNYKANGEPFYNQFFVAPLRDVQQKIVYYVGAQCVVVKPIPSLDDSAVRTMIMEGTLSRMASVEG